MPLTVVILLHLALKRGPIRIQADFRALIVGSHHWSSSNA